MSLQEKTFTYKDITVHFWIIGKGKPLLFLSGGIRALTYQKNVDILAREFTVYLVDLPGFGNSSVPQNIWGLSEYAEFLTHFITYLRIQNFPIIGHSLGGGIGLALAAMDERVSRLIIVGGAGITPPIRKWRFYFNLAIQKTIYDMIHAKNYRIQTIILNNGLSTIRENIWSSYQLVKIANNCIFTDFAHFNQVKVPVSLVWGEEDELFPLSCGKKMIELLPSSTLKVVSGNHDWCLLDPERFYDEVMSHLFKVS